MVIQLCGARTEATTTGLLSVKSGMEGSLRALTQNDLSLPVLVPGSGPPIFGCFSRCAQLLKMCVLVLALLVEHIF